MTTEIHTLITQRDGLCQAGTYGVVCFRELEDGQMEVSGMTYYDCYDYYEPDYEGGWTEVVSKPEARRMWREYRKDGFVKKVVDPLTKCEEQHLPNHVLERYYSGEMSPENVGNYL